MLKYKIGLHSPSTPSSSSNKPRSVSLTAGSSGLSSALTSECNFVLAKVSGPKTARARMMTGGAKLNLIKKKQSNKEKKNLGASMPNLVGSVAIMPGMNPGGGRAMNKQIQKRQKMMSKTRTAGTTKKKVSINADGGEGRIALDGLISPRAHHTKQISETPEEPGTWDIQTAISSCVDKEADLVDSKQAEEEKRQVEQVLFSEEESLEKSTWHRNKVRPTETE